MQNLTPKLKIVGLFFLLLIVSLAPLALTEYDNHSRMNVLNISEIPAEAQFSEEAALIDPKKNATSFISDKLKIIIAAKSQTTGVFTEKKYEEISEEQKNMIISAMKQQLALLQEAGAIPPIDPALECGIASLYKMSFMDRYAPNQNVDIWDVQVNYPEFTIFAWMDVDTKKIYQLGILVKNEVFELDTDGILFTDFTTYLGIPIGQISYRKTDKNIIEYYDLSQDDIYATYCLTKDKSYLQYSLTSY